MRELLKSLNPNLRYLYGKKEVEKLYPFASQLNLDTLEQWYDNEIMAKVIQEKSPQKIGDVFTKADLQYMQKQYNTTKSFNTKKYAVAADTLWLSSSRNKGIKFSIPLFSKDRKKCIFIKYEQREKGSPKEKLPMVFVCRKESVGIDHINS